MGDGEVSTPAPSAGESEPTQPTGVEHQQQTAPVVQDDPEVDLEGIKLKRSEWRDLHTRRKELDRGAFDKMQEAARLRKEAESFRSEAKQIFDSFGSDVKSALRKAGKDPVKVAEEILQEALSEYQMSPAEKEARTLKEENARYKAEQAEREQNEKKTQEAAAVTQWEQRFDQAFTGAIQTVGLPKTARVVARMAEKVDSYWSAGIQVPLEEIAAEIKSDIIQERRELIQSMKDDQGRESLFDDSEFEIVRKAALRKAQSAPQKPQVQQRAAPPKPKNGLTRAELDARISKRIGA